MNILKARIFRSAIIVLGMSVFVIGISTLACKKDKDNDPTPCGTNFNFWTELSDEANAFGTAASNYGQNPTTANCEAYRSAANAYLDAARDLENCATQAGQRDDYLQAIDEAQESLDNLQC